MTTKPITPLAGVLASARQKVATSCKVAASKPAAGIWSRAKPEPEATPEPLHSDSDELAARKRAAMLFGADPGQVAQADCKESRKSATQTSLYRKIGLKPSQQDHPRSPKSNIARAFGDPAKR